MKQMVLKNNNNQIIRFFNCETNKVYLVYRKNKKRLDLCSSPDFFNKEPILLIDEFQVNEIKRRPVPGMDAVIESYSESQNLGEFFSDLKIPIQKDFFKKLFVGSLFVYLLFAFFIYNFQFDETYIKQVVPPLMVELKRPKVVTQIKKVFPNRDLGSVVANQTSTKQIPKKALKKLGVLAALGEASKSEALQSETLNFSDDKLAQGPGGFQGIQVEEGGVRGEAFSLALEGMISSAFISGGKIKGGLGHGTKGMQDGAGGGATSDYAQLDLIGSAGDEELSNSSALGTKGLDFNIINREFLKKYALFRTCYLEALKTEPQLEGLFQFYFQINQKGQVIKSYLSSSSPVQSQLISSCVFSIVNQMEFPVKLHSISQLAYSFDLSELDN